MSYTFTCPGCEAMVHCRYASRSAAEPDEVCAVCWHILHPEVSEGNLANRVKRALAKITSPPDVDLVRELGRVEVEMQYETPEDRGAYLVARREEILVLLQQNVKWRLFRAAAARITAEILRDCDERLRRLDRNELEEQ